MSVRTAMFTVTLALPLAFALPLAGGCAPKVPAELASARMAYERANGGDTARLAPAELHIAAEALATAEASFEKHPKAFETLDLAYVAERKAQMATAHGGAERSAALAADAAKNLAADQTAALATAQGDLALAEQARDAAEAALAELAAVKHEPRGLVITLSGSVLFASGQSALLPGAQTKLSDVGKVLGPVAQALVVEGHTDSSGTDEDNVALSQRRADTVRSFLVDQGYPAALVTAQGMGEAKPVATNDTPEGRANNRRVEIVVSNAGQGAP